MNIHVTGLSTFKQCRRKFWLSDIIGLQSVKPSLPMLEGAAFHAAVAAYYTARAQQVSPQKQLIETDPTLVALEALKQYWDTEAAEVVDEELQKSIELSYFMVEEYIDWAWENDGYQKILAVEFPLEWEWDSGYNSFSGTVDMVVETADGIWIVDHKCVASYKQYDIMAFDDQMNAYMYLWDKLTDKPCNGAIYSQMRRKLPSTPQIVEKGTRISNRACDTTHREYMRVIQENGFDPTDYTEVLSELKVKSWIKREIIPKSNARMQEYNGLIGAELQILMESIEDYELFPTYTWDCQMCQFSTWCRTKMEDGDLKYVEENLYNKDTQRRYKRPSYSIEGLIKK
jgi:hypothetical protein